MSQKSRERKSLDKSRASQSQSQSQSAPALSDEEFRALAADVITFMLRRHHENKISTRQDIITHVIRGKLKGQKVDVLMEKVAKRFDKIFGIKLVHVGKENKHFTLVNKQKELEGSLSLYGSDTELEKQGLLTMVLTFLYMMKNPVKEERLYRFLMQMGILENETYFKHEKLGDIKDLLTKEFVRQQFLVYADLPSHDPDDKVKVFQWGERAHSTISKNDMFKFLGKIYDCPPNRWEQMFDDVEDRCGDSDSD